MKQFLRTRVPAALLLAFLTFAAATARAEEQKDSAPLLADAKLAGDVNSAKPAPEAKPADASVEVFADDTSALDIPVSLFAANTEAELKDSKELRAFLLFKQGHSAAAVARALTETFMTDEEYKQEVEKVRQRYADFEHDTQRDISNYLNDRLVIHGLAAANGKIEKIKKGLVWLSMYKEFQQPAPAFVEKFLKDNIDSLTLLFKDFNWDRASNYIKNREWRKNEEKKTALVE